MTEKPDVWLEASKQLASKLGLTYTNGELSRGAVVKSLGGWLGIVESILPTIAFVVLFQVTNNIATSLIVSGTLSGIALVRQLIVKSALSQAVVGAISIAFTAWLTIKDSNASDYFLTGLITNTAYFAVALLSLAVRWPLVGVIVGFLIGEGFTWRSKSAHFKRFAWATGIYCSLFATRLLIEGPLYLAHNLAALGVAKLILGTPLYVLTLWLIWLVVKPLIRRAS